MVNFFFPFGQLFISHLILPRPMPCFLQALELTGGDGGNDLGKPQSEGNRGGHESKLYCGQEKLEGSFLRDTAHILGLEDSKLPPFTWQTLLN